MHRIGSKTSTTACGSNPTRRRRRLIALYASAGAEGAANHMACRSTCGHKAASAGRELHGRVVVTVAPARMCVASVQSIAKQRVIS